MKKITRIKVVDRQTQETYQGSFANDVDLRKLKRGSSIHIRVDNQTAWISIFKIRGWVGSMQYDNVIIIDDHNKKFQLTAIP
jgi:hypothetical protein